MNSIFSIQNLICQYRTNQPVLQIEDLMIPAGQMVFIIGASGVGKSTLIETLGLMNNTIAKQSKTRVHLQVAEQTVALADIWSQPADQLSSIRRQFYSFLFQQNNLMPNFSAGENMSISLLMGGKSIAQAKEEIIPLMERIKLSADLFDRPIADLSGGQRQRLAFIRAVTAEYAVLFGDEPTGNLDRKTAVELFEILQKEITNRKKSALIVSHDLYLATRFADLIIPITTHYSTTAERKYGVIERHKIISKRDKKWYDAEHESINQPESYLQQFL